MVEPEYRHALPKGCRLENYRVVDVLGVGGFGITYLAEHVRLDNRVAIKEYLPNEFAMRDGATVHPKSSSDDPNFEWGMERFLDEARILTKFQHPNLVKVQDYFEANGTAYFVMQYEIGQPLSRILSERRTLTERQLLGILLPIIDGLKVVHAENILHRDIKPANIFINRVSESPVLLDFGAARHFIGQQTKSMTALASPGYSPYEQYYGADAEQGPWTDIYSLAAVCWRAIQGSTPVEATRRMSNIARQLPDPLPTLENSDAYSPALLEAVNAGLQVIDTDRPRDLEAWQRVMAGVDVDAARGASLGRTAPRGDEQSAEQTPALKAVAPKQTALDATATKPRRRNAAIVISALAGIGAATTGLALWWFLGQPVPQRLTITTTPAAARVVIHGIDQPYRPQGVDLPPGSYQIEVSADEYEAVERTIELGRRPMAVAVSLMRLPQPLSVDVEPAGAQMVLAGQPGFASGMRLPAGTYRVEVTADGFEPTTAVIEHDAQPTRASVSLSPALYPLTILAEPAEALIKVMNIAERYVPGMKLGSGIYDVEVSAPSYETWREKVAHRGTATEHKVVLVAVASQRQAPAASPAIAPIARADQARVPPVSAPQMVMIRGGQFRMGDLSGRYPNEGPVRIMRVGDFLLSRYEVTIAQYNRFAVATHRELLPVPFVGWDEHPAQVSWHDAAAYAAWLAAEAGRPFRLPSEVEWEYAARAGGEQEFSFGNDVREVCTFGNVMDQAWLEQMRQLATSGNDDFGNAVACDDNHVGTAAVGQFEPNGFGLYDMHGNLWEWVEDCYSPSYNRGQLDAVAWSPDVCRSGQRVARGGAANSPPSRFRSASRVGFEPDARSAIGFRVATALANEANKEANKDVADLRVLPRPKRN